MRSSSSSSASSSSSSSPSRNYQSVRRRMCANIIPGRVIHLSNLVTERGLSESLLELEDESQDVDYNFTSNISFEMADSLSAWQDVAPNARIIQRKKRVPMHSADDVQLRARNRVEEYSKLNKKTVESLFTTAALWRMCVEQTTYRYIPNNGRYRLSKSDSKFDQDGKLARTIRTMEKLSPEQRTLQEEIQRELRAEFEMQQKLERQAEHNRQRAIESRKFDSRGPPRPDKPDYTKKPAKDPSFHRRIKTPVELPPINVPLIGKSIHESYMSSFHVRLTNLEEEMKRDQVLLKKNQHEYAEGNMTLANAQVFRSNSEPGPIMRSSHYMDFSGLPLFTEPVTEECLSVRPITNRSGKSSVGLSLDDGDNDIRSSGHTSQNNLDDNGKRTGLVKYRSRSTPNGEAVRSSKSMSNGKVTKTTASVISNATASPTDQNLILRTSNVTLNQSNKGSLQMGITREQALHARELMVNTYFTPPSTVTVSPSLKCARTHRKLASADSVYDQNDPPIIVAEGLFSQNKASRTAENLQLTVKARKRNQGHDSMAHNFISGVAGKNCEVSQKT